MGSVKSVAGFHVFVACIHYILGTVSYRPNRSPESRCYIHNHHDHCFCCWCSTSSSSSSSYALANNGPQYCSFFGVLRIPTTKRRDWVQSSPRRFFDMNWAGKTPSPDSEEEQGQGHDTNKTRRKNCWFARCTAENEVISFRFFGYKNSSSLQCCCSHSKGIQSWGVGEGKGGISIIILFEFMVR